MVVGFTTTCQISAYRHWSWEFEPFSWRGVLDTAFCGKVCQWLASGRWFSPGTPNPVFSTSKTDRHDITEILLKVALNIIKLNQTKPIMSMNYSNVLQCPLCVCWIKLSTVKRWNFIPLSVSLICRIRNCQERMINIYY